MGIMGVSTILGVFLRGFYSVWGIIKGAPLLWEMPMWGFPLNRINRRKLSAVLLQPRGVKIMRLRERRLFRYLSDGTPEL